MTFSQKMFLTENARYFYELHLFKNQNSLECENSDSRIEEWKDCLDSENCGYFEKRLDMQNLSLKDATELLKNTNVRKPAQWTNSAEKILNLMPSQPEKIISMIQFGTLNNYSEFYAYLAPVLLYVQQELSDIFKIDILSKNAAADIMDDFFKHIKFIFEHFGKYQINKLAETILPQPIENLSEYYKTFCREMINGGYEKCFFEYPCLARCLVETLDLRISFVREAVLNFDKDKPIKGQITGFKLSAGDVHNYGRSVIVAEYNKTKIVYKPQNGHVYTAYGELLSFLYKSHILCEMKYAKVLSSYFDHCYIEFVDHEPITDIKDGLGRYYYRIGQLTCLFYALGSEDMHYENIISHGEYPVAIDLETLLTAKANKFETINYKRNINYKTERKRSKISTNEINMVTKSLMLDFGGVCGGVALLDGNKENIPYYSNRTEIDLGIAGENIIRGFNDAYSKIQANKDIIVDKLSLFNTCRFRSIIRSTELYCEMLDHLQYVKYLQSGLTRSFETERIFSAYRDICELEKLKSMYPVFNEECVSLLRGDVPIFFAEANECGIISSDGKLNDDFFEISPIDNAKLILEKMNDEDRDAQNKIIQMTISSTIHTEIPVISVTTSQTKILSESEFIDETEKIFDTLIERQIFSGQGNLFLNVHTEEKNGHRRKCSICTANSGLYSGLSGIALFCGAMFCVTNKKKYKDLAVEIIDQVCNDLIYISQKTEIGISNGIGGYALACSLVSDYIGEPKYKCMAANIISLPDDLSMINKIDSFSGLSGYIIAACNAKADISFIEQAADRLTELRVPCNGLMIWKNDKFQKPLTGLGHGLSGVALALAAAYRFLPKNEYLQGALDALKYEEHCYNEKYGWPDLRDDYSGYMSGICSGAPGVGIARLAMKGIAPELDKYLECDISNAVRHSVESFPLNKDDLCCGNCSGIDFLISVGRQCNNSKILSDAGKKLSWIIMQKRKNGIYSSVTGTNPEPTGFFDGICGIGYELLRWCDDRIKGIFDFCR